MKICLSLSVALLLAACGQSGPLVLPDRAPARPVTASPTAEPENSSPRKATEAPGPSTPAPTAP